VVALDKNEGALSAKVGLFPSRYHTQILPHVTLATYSIRTIVESSIGRRTPERVAPYLRTAARDPFVKLPPAMNFQSLYDTSAQRLGLRLTCAPNDSTVFVEQLSARIPIFVDSKFSLRNTRIHVDVERVLRRPIETTPFLGSWPPTGREGPTSVTLIRTQAMPELLIKRTRFHISTERLFAWHAEPEALERLTPPWEHSHVIRRTGTIRDIGSRIEIRVRVGPFWRTWISEHTACEEGRMFRDSQIEGPFALWRHTHSFEPDGPSACYLEDRVEYALPMGALGSLVAGRFVRRKLDRLFSYRHESTAEALHGG